VEKVVLNSDANIKKIGVPKNVTSCCLHQGEQVIDLSDPAAYNRLTFVGTVLAKDLY